MTTLCLCDAVGLEALPAAPRPAKDPRIAPQRLDLALAHAFGAARAASASRPSAPAADVARHAGCADAPGSSPPR